MKTELPVIEKGVPIPDVKRADGRCVPKSPWPAFLETLVPGDSFVLACSVSTNVMNIAKWSGVPLIKFELPRKPGDLFAMVRIWRVEKSES